MLEVQCEGNHAKRPCLIEHRPTAAAEGTLYVTSLSLIFRARAVFSTASNIDIIGSESHPIYKIMSSREPPWRNERSRLPQRSAPTSTIPAKRSADPRAHEHPAKRSTNAAEEAWVADEDRFALQQAKKKAALRVKGGRAKPIDWLAVTLRFIDPTEKNILDEEVEDHELDVVDPEGVLEGLDTSELLELEKEIESYLTLETNRSNRDYWSVSNSASSISSVC